jgi:hypothetical protein
MSSNDRYRDDRNRHDRNRDDRPIHVVGGGIAGLVAAITAAEAGAPVVLHEAADRLGGRALGGADLQAINYGPHVVHAGGALTDWLAAYRVRVPLRPFIPRGGVQLLDDRGPHFPSLEALRLVRTFGVREAPVDETFRDWAERRFDRPTAELLARFTGLYTFHHDPGSLSAQFVWAGYRRAFVRSAQVRWIPGGWTTLIDALAARAAGLGVQIATGERLEAGDLPDGPTVVATPLAIAGRLLERRLEWTGARTALLDVVATPDRRWPALVADLRSDLTTCCMVERETIVDPGRSGGERADVFQAHLGIAPGVGSAEGVARIESAMDAAVEGWRDRTVWRRGHIVANATGAVDLPGTIWRDRPAIDQGDYRYLAGDMVAAPGMLCEVSVNSAVRAAHLALDARRQRAYAIGWPAALLSPERRLAVLAAVLPGATLAAEECPPTRPAFDPAMETGAGYRLTTGRRGTTAVAETVTDGRVTIMTLKSSRRP